VFEREAFPISSVKSTRKASCAQEDKKDYSSTTTKLCKPRENDTSEALLLGDLPSDDVDATLEGMSSGDACRSSVKLSKWGNESFSTIFTFRSLGPLPANDAFISPQNEPISGSSLVELPAGFPHSPLILQTDWTHGTRCYHGVVAMTKATAWGTGPAQHISNRCAVGP
jgi:hypothetical protein